MKITSLKAAEKALIDFLCEHAFKVTHSSPFPWDAKITLYGIWVYMNNTHYLILVRKGQNFNTYFTGHIQKMEEVCNALNIPYIPKTTIKQFLTTREQVSLYVSTAHKWQNITNPSIDLVYTPEKDEWEDNSNFKSETDDETLFYLANFVHQCWDKQRGILLGKFRSRRSGIYKVPRLEGLPI